MPENPWWKSFFTPAYADLDLNPTSEEALAKTEAAADFIIEALGLQQGVRVLDQCSGTGRISAPLAKRGMSMVGVDQSEEYITQARGRFEAAGLEGEFVAADAHVYARDGDCDAVINWFSSFGYSADDEENLRMLKAGAACLKVGGHYMLDLPNLYWVFANWNPIGVRKATSTEGETFLIDERSFYPEEGVFRSRWTGIHPDGRRFGGESVVRAYTPRELGALMGRAGLRELRFFGATDGQALGPKSPRMIVVGTK